MRLARERNWRVCRSKPATRQLENHVQGQLIYSLCHIGGEGQKPSRLNNRGHGKGSLSGWGRWSSHDLSNPLPAAGLSLHKAKVWDSLEQDAELTMWSSSRTPRSSGLTERLCPASPTCILMMLQLCIPTQGQVAVPQPQPPQPTSSKPTAISMRADALFKTCILKILIDGP